VPADVKVVSAAGLRSLVKAAQGAGFSRRAADLDIDDELTYALVPVLAESSPSSSWICLVISFRPAARLGWGVRPVFGYARIEVSPDGYRSLRTAGRRTRNQLLHWLAWQAYATRKKG